MRLSNARVGRVAETGELDMVGGIRRRFVNGDDRVALASKAAE